MPAPRVSKTKAKMLAKAQRISKECKVSAKPVVLDGTHTIPYDGEIKVELRDCEYGKGVFATKDIAKGEIITGYGGVLSKQGDTGTTYTDISVSMDDYNKEHEYTVDVYWNDISYNLNGYDAPRDDARLCGHLVNDPSDWSDLTIYADLEKDHLTKGCNVNNIMLLIAYLSKKHANGVVKGNCRPGDEKLVDGRLFVPLLAIRDIKAGEQVYYHYGLPYWCGRTLETLVRSASLDYIPFVEKESLWNIVETIFGRRWTGVYSETMMGDYGRKCGNDENFIRDAVLITMINSQGGQSFLKAGIKTLDRFMRYFDDLMPETIDLITKAEIF